MIKLPGAAIRNNIMIVNYLTPIRTGSIITCLFIIGVIFYSSYQSRLNFQQRARSNSENIALLLDQSISALIIKSDMALRLVVDESEKEIVAGGIRRDDINSHIAHIISLNPELLSIRVVDSDGTVRYGIDHTGTILPIDSRVNVSDRPYFLQAKADKQQYMIVTPPFFGRLISKWVIQLVRRISLPDGSFGGVSYVSFDVHHFDELIRIENLSFNSSVTLRTLDLQMVARYSPSATGPTDVGNSQVSDALREVINNHQNSGFYTAHAGIDGASRMYNFRKTALFPGYVFVGVSINDLDREWLLEAMPTIIIGFIFIAIIIVAARRLEASQLRAEAALRDSQEVATALMNATPDAALLLDDAGTVLAANDELARRFKLHVSDLIGSQFFDLLPQDLATKRRSVCANVIESGLPIVHNDERNGLMLENRIFPVRSDDGHIRRVAIYSRDIGDMLNAQRELEDLGERYRLLFDNSPDAYLIMEIERGTISECNRAAEIMLRCDKAQILGSTPDELSPPFQPGGKASTEAAEEKIIECVRDRRNRFEWVHRRFDGCDFWAEVSISLTSYQNRQVMFVAWREIEERKAAEAKIRESELRFRHLADTVPVLIWLADTNKLCYFFNKQWFDFTGRTLEQEDGNGWVDGIHPDDLQPRFDTYVTCFDARQPFAMEYRLRRYDGEFRWLLDQGAPRYDFDGTFLGYVGGCIDITERKAAEERLIEARRTAETASRTKSAFLAMMSHELRTPMTGVIGMADFLAETALNQDQRSYVDTMRSSAKTLLTILNDILDFSKIDADRLTLHSMAFDAISMAAETVRLFWPKAEENANTIELDAGGITTLPVKGDPTRIKQVLGNLISNAVKFTKAGKVVIFLRQRDLDGRVFLEFAVEDTGIGIADADMKRLFVPFSQADVGGARKFGGTGLGLAISKRLVELMGGEISVTSKPNCGSTFRFTCLVDRGRQEDLAVGHHETVYVRPMNILLAEDNAINRMIVKVGLENRNHAVTMVVNGAQACEAAAARQFDVILMDMQMPVMDGTEATKRIRALPPPYSEVPIVALTADALPEHRAAYMDAGLTDFLTKPVEWNEVDIVLARLHSRLRKRSAMPRDIGHVFSEDDRRHLVDHNRLADIRNQMTLSDFNVLIREIIPFTRDEVSRLKEAFASRNLPDIRRAAHSIKGMFLNIGGDKVAAVAKEIQECENIDTVSALITELSTAVNETAIEMERFSTD